MKFLSTLLSVILVSATGAFAAAPSTNAPPAAPAPAAKGETPAPAPAPSAPGTIFDAYVNELTATLKLSDGEKKDIEAFYVTDGALLKNTLNNEALSPLEKAQQVSDIRDTRNAKIEVLLHDVDRQQAFLKIEARYRVALVEEAADHGLVATPTAPAAPATAPATNAPAAAK